MLRSVTAQPSSPLTTSFTVPSPPTAATTSTPRRAASAAIAADSPASNVVSRSTQRPFSRTPSTRCLSSGRSSRAPWMISAICLERMPPSSAYHAPVLAAETIELLGASSRVLDCTLGGGGHSQALLEAGVQTVIGVDRDPDALAAANQRLGSYATSGRFSAIQSNYADVTGEPALARLSFDGILLDLGISSHQVDAESRGFTFRPGAPLDMRMGPDAERSADDLLNEESVDSLSQIFREFGYEPRAERLAREIVRRRGNHSFATSDDLVKAIRAVLGPKSGSGDFARLFQAVRVPHH